MFINLEHGRTITDGVLIWRYNETETTADMTPVYRYVNYERIIDVSFQLLRDKLN